MYSAKSEIPTSCTAATAADAGAAVAAIAAMNVFFSLQRI